MRTSSLAFTATIVIAFLIGQISAQYTPNVGNSIGLLNSVANSNTATQAQKDAASAAAQTAKEVDKNKGVQDAERPNPKDKSDGSTMRMPKNVYRKGHETKPERIEIIFINGRRIRERYRHMIDRGLTVAEATAACDWIVAFIIAHECVHVNQSNDGNPGQTSADREKEAYEEEKKVEDGALSDPNLDEDVKDEIERFRNEGMIMNMLINLLSG